MTPAEIIASANVTDPEQHTHIPLKTMKGHVTWTGKEPPSDEFMEAMELLAKAAVKAIESGILIEEKK